MFNDATEMIHLVDPDGRTDFESRVDKGSTFWIELPLVREKATKGATTETMKRMPEIRGNA